jgi:hypothetical protein
MGRVDRYERARRASMSCASSGILGDGCLPAGQVDGRYLDPDRVR